MSSLLFISASSCFLVSVKLPTVSISSSSGFSTDEKSGFEARGDLGGDLGHTPGETGPPGCGNPGLIGVMGAFMNKAEGGLSSSVPGFFAWRISLVTDVNVSGKESHCSKRPSIVDLAS